MSRTSWEDLVFENRNQSYGAYDLRKAYSRAIVVAFAAALTLIAIVIAFPTIRNLFSKQEKPNAPEVRPVRYTDLAPPPPIDKNVIPPPKVEVPPIKEVVKFIPPKVTTKEVSEEEALPTIDDLKKNEISTQSTEGEGIVITDDPVEEVTQEPVEDPNKTWTTVEIPPEFPGGMAAMMKFLSRNMRYPAAARRMGTEGTVFVGFVVAPDGQIVEVQTIKGIAGDCDREAMRVIQSMPPWKPGKQNGKPVRVRFVLPIKFVLGSI